MAGTGKTKFNLVVVLLPFIGSHRADSKFKSPVCAVRAIVLASYKHWINLVALLYERPLVSMGRDGKEQHRWHSKESGKDEER